MSVQRLAPSLGRPARSGRRGRYTTMRVIEGRYSAWEPSLLRMPRGLAATIREGRGPVVLRRRELTALWLLILFLCLQFLIPARLVIGGMGAAGRPAVALGLGLTFLWVLAFLTRRGLPEGAQPVRWVIGGYVALQLFGYAVGLDRGLPAVEASNADRWVIFTFAIAGIALATADGIATRAQLDRLLTVLVGLGAVMAFIGALQFAEIVDITEYIRIPGLQLNADLINASERGGPGFPRVAATANHYIEFGVVLAMLLPLALHYVFFATSRRQKAWRWGFAGLIALGIPLSISRSAVLSVAVGLILLAFVWPWRQKFNAAVIGGCAVIAFHAIQPGVLGTIRALFTNVDDDPSVQARIARTDYVFNLWELRPWLGRGAGSYVPDQYILLDNQLYMTLLEGGIVGLSGLALFLLVPYFLARSLRLRGADQETRHLAQALAVVPPVALLASGTFDSFFFATFVGVLFLAIGAIGALWRLDGGGAGRRPLQPAAPGDRFVASPLMAHWRR